MAIVDRVKYDQPNDQEFVWKFPGEELKLGSQVIVNQAQDAVFVKGGEVLDVLPPGTHTLETGNIPLLNRLLNLPFGGDTPFTAEIWYVNKNVKRDLKWGTPSPVPIMDLALGFPVSVRSFGKWGARITDTRSFLTQIVGSQNSADALKLQNYFIGEIIQKLISVLSEGITNDRISILQIAGSLNELSERTYSSISDEFDRFGLEVVNFNIESINIPDDQMAQIQEVFSKAMEARELSKVEVGGAYQAIKTFEVLNAAAENPGDGAGVGAMLGAGIGLGAGLPIGQQLGQNLNVEAKGGSAVTIADRLRELKTMLDENLITEEEFNTARDKIIDEI